MAKTVYNRMKNTAASVLKKYGAACTITTREGESLKGFGVFLGSETTNGETANSNDKTVYFQGSDKVAPASGDRLTIKKENWGIVAVEDINPDGQLTIMFNLTVRKP